MWGTADWGVNVSNSPPSAFPPSPLLAQHLLNPSPLTKLHHHHSKRATAEFDTDFCPCFMTSLIFQHSPFSDVYKMFFTSISEPPPPLDFPILFTYITTHIPKIKLKWTQSRLYLNVWCHKIIWFDYLTCGQAARIHLQELDSCTKAQNLNVDLFKDLLWRALSWWLECMIDVMQYENIG